MSVNILIVDDSRSMRSVIRKTVAAAGISVGEFFEAVNGLEALDVLSNSWVDIVILDYNMPGMDGMELLDKLQDDDFFKTIPVLVTSVEGSKKRVQSFLEHGAAAYIKKPFTPEETRDKLYQLLGGGINGEDDSHWSDETLDF